MASTVFGVAIARAPWETVEQNAQTVEVVEMGVRYIDGLQVAIVQCDPIRESLGLSHCPHCVHQYRVVLAEDQSRRDRVKAERFAEWLGPLADHSLPRGGKNVHAKRVRRDRRPGFLSVPLFRPFAAPLCGNPFDPLSAKCGSREWIRKVLCFPRNLVARELHDAHGVGRFAVIGQDQFGDPKITAANDSLDSKPFLARLTGALALYVASDRGFARLTAGNPAPRPRDR